MAQHLVGGQAQGQCQGPLLAVGGEAAGGQGAQEEGQVVAVGAHEVRAAVDLPGAQRPHGRLQAGGDGAGVGQPGLDLRPVLAGARVGFGSALVQGQAGAVGDERGGGVRADRPVRAGHPGAQALDDVDARGDEAGGRRGELGVPHLQGGQHRGGRGPGGAGGPEQAGALGEDLVVLGAHAGQGGPQGDGQVVEEPTAPGRLLAHQGQVLGGEQDGAQHAEQVAGAHGPPVEAGPVGPAGDDLQLHDGGPPAVDDPGPQHRPAGLLVPRPGAAHERGVRARAVAGQARQVVDGLDEVGLALPVGADEGRDPGLEGDHEPAVGAEVLQGEVGDVHGRGPAGLRRRSGSA